MNKSDLKRPEILAPCGNPAAFHAALSAGADAMYLAMDRFGARAYAGNFQQNELLQAIEEAHLHDRKIYLTLNTLLKNDEIRQLPEALDPLYRAGLDAVLVQDFGVYGFLRERYPDMPLHASTQMNLCSVEGARLAKTLGFSRVVPARELSLTELRMIRDEAGIEVEAFVHGAMCVCYSGRCYLSSFAGGRSGNRGRCAQPCRAMYNGGFPLSMKDLCTLEDVPALMEAGIDSLKIEGRMKNEYYVAACVDAYRTMVEDVMLGEFRPEKAQKYRERMTEVFHRGGFTRGYLNQFSGPDMISDTASGHTGVKVGTIRKVRDGVVRIRCEKGLNKGDSLEIPVPDGTDETIRLTAPEDAPDGTEVELRAPMTRKLQPGMPLLRVRNAALMAEMEERYLTKQPKVPADLTVLSEVGKPFRITARANGISVSLEGPKVETASGKPVTEETLQAKIGTLSGTDFFLSRLMIQNDGQSFVPVSVIKNQRRDVLSMLREALLDPKRRRLLGNAASEDIDPEKDIPLREKNKEEKKDAERIFFVSDLSMAETVLSHDPAAVIFDFGLSCMDPEEVRRLAGSNRDIRFLVGFPYIFRHRGNLEKRMEELYRMALELDGAYINGIDSFAWFKSYAADHDKPGTLYLGDSLYRYNDRAVDFFSRESVDLSGELWMEEPCELSLSERHMIRVPENVKRIPTVYGHRPMMLTVQEAAQNLKGTDGKRTRSLILLQNPEMCYNVVLSGQPILQDADGGPSAVRFTVEGTSEAERLINAYFSESASDSRLNRKPEPEGIRHRGLL